MVEVNVLFLANKASFMCKQNGAVDLNIRCDYSELGNYIKLLQMLNNDINIKAKLPNESKGLKLGMFRLKQLSVQSDGEGKISFSSTNDYIESLSLNKLIGEEFFKVMCSSEIEVENEDEDSENDE